MQFLQGLIFFILGNRLAMPALLVLKEGDALALLGFGDDHRRLAFGLKRLGVGLVDLLVVVAINFDGMPAKGLRTGRVGRCVPAQLGLTTLAQTVAVQNSNQVIRLIETSL